MDKIDRVARALHPEFYVERVTTLRNLKLETMSPEELEAMRTYAESQARRAIVAMDEP